MHKFAALVIDIFNRVNNLVREIEIFTTDCFINFYQSNRLGIHFEVTLIGRQLGLYRGENAC